MGLDLGTVRGEGGQKGVAAQGGPRPTTGETGLPADVSSPCRREGRRCWGSLLAGWPAKSGVYSYPLSVQPFTSSLPLFPPPPQHTHWVPRRAPGGTTQPPPGASRGGDSVPGAGAAPSGQEGVRASSGGSRPRLAPRSHSHPGFVCQAPGCLQPAQASKATTSYFVPQTCPVR